jgi:hypothetical protein
VAWQSADGGGVHLSPLAVANGVLYTVDPAGTLVARDPASGMVLTRLSLGGPSFGGVSATGGAVYVSVGLGPPPEPAPQQRGTGSIIAFGDTSRSGGTGGGGGDVVPPRLLHLRLIVSPRRVSANRPVRLHIRTSSRGKSVARVRVRVGRRLVRTGRRGRVQVRMRFSRPGAHMLRASLGGYDRAHAMIRVVRR